MNNEDFKAPDVVWINNVDIEEFNAYTTHVFGAAIYSTKMIDCVKFINANTAEANTRKAVREALIMVMQRFLTNDVSPALYIHKQVWMNYFNQLLTQYQDSQPTKEATNENNS